MIILHSQHEEASRAFVEAYGEGNTVIPYPECVKRFPWIRAFPSVILEVGEHSVPRGWLGPDQVAYNVPAHEELIDTPKDWDTVERSRAFVEEWCKVSPPIKGTEFIHVQGEKKTQDG